MYIDLLSGVTDKDSPAFNLYHPLKDFLLEKTNKTVFIDLETYTRNGRFLNNERILAIGLLEYSSSRCLPLVLKNNNESEKRLLSRFSEHLDKIEPDVVVGYGIRYYDIPLLSQKYMLYRKVLSLNGLRDMLNTSLIVDLAPFCRYDNSYRGLKDIIVSNPDIFGKDCAELKQASEKRDSKPSQKSRLKRHSGWSEKKARWIYDTWRKNRRKFIKYVECDVKACRELYKQLLGEL